MQMCDALAANAAGEFQTVLANCLAHGRRQVADVAEQFPEAARYPKFVSSCPISGAHRPLSRMDAGSRRESEM
jgi:hypothetical protein